VSKGIPVVPYRVDDVEPSTNMQFSIAASRSFDGRDGNVTKHAQQLVRALRQLLPGPVSQTAAIQAAEPQMTSKGYVFISYVRSD
jgi:hypothetical protein